MNRYDEARCTAIMKTTDIPREFCIDIVRTIRKQMISDCRALAMFSCLPKCSEDEYVDNECLDKCMEELYPYVCKGKVPEWFFTGPTSLK